MQGSEILLNVPPRGRFFEGILQAGVQPYPGTMMQMVNGVGAVNGRFQWNVYESASGADGDPRLVTILDIDHEQGGIFSTQYNQSNINGVRCFLYVPYPGEEANCRVAAQVGTGSANAYTVGERFIIQHATGYLIQTLTSSVNASWMSLEHIDITADVTGLVWCQRQ